jgi:hypothetical protein
VEAGILYIDFGVSEVPLFHFNIYLFNEDIQLKRFNHYAPKPR